ncbi:MAG: hypothetical protein ACE5NJ_09745, partial [Thermodesulfobacteriota bacterium]
PSLPSVEKVNIRSNGDGSPFFSLFDFLDHHFKVLERLYDPHGGNVRLKNIRYVPRRGDAHLHHGGTVLNLEANLPEGLICNVSQTRKRRTENRGLELLPKQGDIRRGLLGLDYPEFKPLTFKIPEVERANEVCLGFSPISLQGGPCLFIGLGLLPRPRL